MVAADLAPSKLDPDLNLGIEKSNITFFFPLVCEGVNYLEKIPL